MAPPHSRDINERTWALRTPLLLPNVLQLPSARGDILGARLKNQAKPLEESGVVPGGPEGKDEWF